MGGPQIQSLISHFAPADFYSFIDDCNISFSLLAWLGINYPYKRDVWCNTVFSESLWSQSPGFVRINKYFTVFVVLVMWLFTRSPFWNCIWLISHNSRLPNTLSLCHFSLASAFSCISRPRLLRDQLWNKDKLQRAYQFYFTKLRHAGYQVRSSWCADQRRKEEELSLLRNIFSNAVEYQYPSKKPAQRSLLFRLSLQCEMKFPRHFKAFDFSTSFHAMTVGPGICLAFGGKPHPPCNLVTVRSNKQSHINNHLFLHVFCFFSVLLTVGFHLHAWCQDLFKYFSCCLYLRASLPQVSVYPQVVFRCAVRREDSYSDRGQRWNRQRDS